MKKENKVKMTLVQRQRRRYQVVVIILSILVIASMVISAIANY